MLLGELLQLLVSWQTLLAAERRQWPEHLLKPWPYFLKAQLAMQVWLEWAAVAMAYHQLLLWMQYAT